MSTSTKPKLARTDYTICVCVDGKHAAMQHVRPPNPVEPSPTVRARYSNGHLVERQIVWTPWKESA